MAERTRDLLARFDAAATPVPDRAEPPDRPDPPPAGAGRWQRLAARVPVRLDPGRRAALSVGVAVLVAAVATGIWLLSSRPRAMSVSASTPPSVAAMPTLGSATPARSSSPGSEAVSVPVSAPAEVVVVDVAGKVRRPGLYRLGAGSRVDDAVRAAGGALPGVDLSSLNLAAKVVDGQQILVGLAGAAPPAAGSGGSGGAGRGATGAATGPVSLNSATLEQLETLPGVGPVLAQHILDWRADHGSFRSVEQLNDVPGIGDVKFAALKPLVTT